MKRTQYREPCSGACCPKKGECEHYDRYMEYKRIGKIANKYVGNGNPSRCYLNHYNNFLDNGK